MAVFGKSKGFKLFFLLKQHWSPFFLNSDAVNPMIHSANDSRITERCILCAFRCASIHKSV